MGTRRCRKVNCLNVPLLGRCGFVLKSLSRKYTPKNRERRNRIEARPPQGLRLGSFGTR
jgi:hypothetical protein